MTVAVVLRVGSAELDLELDVARAAPVGVVLRALAGGSIAADAALLVDGRRVPPDATVADLAIRRGSVLEIATANACSGDDVDTGSAVDLWLAGGLHAGQRVRLAPGSHIIGCAPTADIGVVAPGISGRHAAVAVRGDGAVRVEDLRSHLGVRLNSRPLTGATSVSAEDRLSFGPVPARCVRPWPAADRQKSSGAVSDSGRVAFHRSLRRSSTAGVVAVAPPLACRDDPPAPRFPWAAVVAPLAIGAFLAAIYSPTLALFALLGPVMALSSWADERRRTMTARRARRREEAAARAVFAAAADAAAAGEDEARRQRHPDPVEVIRRAASLDRRLWERRPGDDDFLELAVGIGTLEWSVPVAPTAGGAPPAADATRRLHEVPLACGLVPGGMLGISGPADDGAAVARWLLCQAAVHHGPADVRVSVVAGPSAADVWDWCKWLPHAEDADGVDSDGAVRIIVVDGGDPAVIRDVRERHPDATVLVLVPRVDDLPQGCTTVIELHAADGSARLLHGHDAVEVLATGLVPEAARAVALSLAALEDPERTRGAQLPRRVTFNELIDLRDAGPDEIARRWQDAGAAPRVVVPIGMTGDGAFVFDLDRDGPHGLIGGTTGSGKSELLRSIVLGLAATLSPEHVSFLLMDFKGGSAFAGLGALPHTVGVVTDLDDRLAARALRSLEAEIRHRERVLREAGAQDLRAYLLAGRGDNAPLPRLVVVIDEFATLAVSFPRFLESLVDVAQRGRALGVHLLLATQRPSGAVSPSVRANTGFRVALRMCDDADSLDVIDTAEAARISREIPGRAMARTEQGRVVTFQAATVSDDRDGDADKGPGVAGGEAVVRPFVGGPRPAVTDPEPTTSPTSRDGGGRLTAIVQLLQAAASAAGCAAPRRPWLDPLPPTVSLDDLRQLGGGAAAPIGLADDPDHQCRHVYGWHPGLGNIAFIGEPSSGADALVTLAVSVAGLCATGGGAHIYGLDFGSGRLGELRNLPEVGTIVGPSDRERQERLIRYLGAELDRRRDGRRSGRADADADATVMVLIDGYAGFHSAFDDAIGLPLREQLTRTLVDGPPFGIFGAVSADRPSAIPPSVAVAFNERLVFRLTDPVDAHLVGVAPSAVARLGPGRAVHVGSGLELQVASSEVPPADDRVLEVTRPPTIDVLPKVVAASNLPVSDAETDDGWSVVVGLDDRTLQPAILRLRDRDGVLVAGPARGGRSTLLVTIAAAVRRASPETLMAAIALRPSPLRSVDGIWCATDDDGCDAVITAMAGGTGPRLLLVDDAEVTDRHGARLTELLERLPDGLRVVAAGRGDSLRNRYGHWTAALRRSASGVLLTPRSDADGELFGVTLPRRLSAAPFPPGRGYLLSDGVLELVQFAQPDHLGRAGDGDAGEDMKRVVMDRTGYAPA